MAEEIEFTQVTTPAMVKYTARINIGSVAAGDEFKVEVTGGTDTEAKGDVPAGKVWTGTVIVQIDESDA